MDNTYSGHLQEFLQPLLDAIGEDASQFKGENTRSNFSETPFFSLLCKLVGQVLIFAATRKFTNLSILIVVHKYQCVVVYFSTIHEFYGVVAILLLSLLVYTRLKGDVATVERRGVWILLTKLWVSYVGQTTYWEDSPSRVG